MLTPEHEMKNVSCVKRYLPKWLMLLAATLLMPNSYAEEFDIREYSLKAVFLERFTRFITWPEDKSPESKINPFVIGIIANPHFAELLRDIYRTQEIQGKKVIVRDIDDLESAKNCQLLFISRDSEEELSKILNQTRSLPILTVSDTDGYAEKGVMINFFMSRKQKIRFEINELAIKESKLYISYKLLSVARIVETE